MIKAIYASAEGAQGTPKSEGQKSHHHPVTSSSRLPGLEAGAAFEI